MRVDSKRVLTMFTITLIAAIAAGWVALDGCTRSNEEHSRAKAKRSHSRSDDVPSLSRHEKRLQDDPFSTTAPDVDHERRNITSTTRSAKGLDIYTATRFDLLLKERCRRIGGLDVRYSGPLSRGIYGQLVHGIQDYLAWQIVGRSSLVVCRLSISLEESEATLVTCEIEGRKLHVSVDYVSDPELREPVDVDTPIGELSGMTIRQLLQPLANTSPAPSP